MRVGAEEEVKQIEGRRGLGFERCFDQMRETTWEDGRREKGGGKEKRDRLRYGKGLLWRAAEERKICRRSEREKWQTV